MGLFFIDTQSGQVATHQQLMDAGVAERNELPPRPWHKVQGSDGASTLWYAVLRKRTHGIFIGSLVFRHSDHHASLLADGWEEVPLQEIRADPHSGPPTEIAPGPFTESGAVVTDDD
ncbi:hypothetical protein FSW04_14680 [Baekduia soli]|uniref:Uncharacterized protein n=1 Tax=Baekduia soli TaxID=496014 RepID=A0A5B8U7N5_9ACTN|nr:hypothetical protein [Baekduia soli]QEC48692.1 hypothetical protein FSW04_14680 [Baekduia soli]